MKKLNKSSFIHSKNKFQWWKKVIVFGVIFSTGIFLTGCEEEGNNDEYYVKYEVNSSTIYSGGKLNVTINTETNANMIISVGQNRTWETIIGPVKKGFNATMEVEAAGETYDKLKLYTNIYVNKNDSPFALKKTDGSDDPRDYVAISYTIDY